MPWCSLYAMVSVNSCLLFNPPLCLGKSYASSSLLLVSRQLMCLKPHLGPHASTWPISKLAHVCAKHADLSHLKQPCSSMCHNGTLCHCAHELHHALWYCVHVCVLSKGHHHHPLIMPRARPSLCS